MRHFILSVKEEIQNRGIIKGIHSSLILFLTRILNINIKTKEIRTHPTSISKFTHNKKEGVPGVVFISGCGGATRRYRVFHQQEELLHHSVPAGVFDHHEINLQTALQRYDIFILHRVPITPEYTEFIQKGKQIGKIFIFETDDLIFDEKYAQYIRALEDMSSEQVAQYVNDLRKFKETMLLCDYAICSTDFIKNELEFFGKTTYVNLNAVSDEMVELAKKALSEKKRRMGDKIRIGYLSGTNTHNLDFKIAEDALIQIFKEFEHVELIIGGYLDLSEKLSPYSERIVRLPFIHWKELPKYLIKFDINISPLEDNPFCNAKSDLKYFEAALLKVPTIASNVGGYSSQIRNFENGILVSTNIEWYNALKLLITDTEMREKIGSNAQRDVLENRNTRVAGENLVNIIRDIERRNKSS